MPANTNDIIKTIQTRLLELHKQQTARAAVYPQCHYSISKSGDSSFEKPPLKKTEYIDDSEFQFSITISKPKSSSRAVPETQDYVESSLPDWAQKLLNRIGLRKDVRIPPNLNSPSPSFAARILIAVRDKFYGYATPLYTAAHIDRRLYSKIISDERRPVSKDTALAFAFALRLNPAEAQELLKSAGHALSPTNDRDIVLNACLENNLHDISKVNEILERFSQPTI